MAKAACRWLAVAAVAAVTAGPTCSEEEAPPGDPPAAEAHVCEKYGRAVPGATWTYETTGLVADDPTWLSVTKYFGTDYDPTTGKFTQRFDITTTSATISSVTTGENQFRCDDDGMWFETLRQQTATTFADGTTTVDDTTFTYTEPALTLPATFGDGRPWTLKGHWESTSSKSGPASGDLRQACEPAGGEEVTVGAGTFDAERVDCGPIDTDDRSPTWYAPYVGVVKGGDYLELVEVVGAP